MINTSAYVTFGRSGLRISPFIFGGGALGQSIFDKDADALLDRYIELGGNVLDTAPIYGYGASESLIGDYMERRKNREELVISTKFSPKLDPNNANAGGNGRKNMLSSAEASLGRLKTDRVEILWLHAWDKVTPAEEVVETMNMLIRAGKILHYGLSNVPSWYVAHICGIADKYNMERPIALQLSYALVERNIELEHVPVAQELGLGICAYSVLADGFLSGKYRKMGDSWEGEGKLDRQRKANFPYMRKILDQDWEVLETLMAVSDELDVPPARLALAWAVSQPGITAPILGSSKVEQLDGHLEALQFKIPEEARARLDSVSRPPIHYPYNFFEPEFQALLEANKGTRKWQAAF